MSFKVALVGLSQLSFYGDKEGRFAQCAKDLRTFLSGLDADLYVYPEQVIVPDDAERALMAIGEEKPDFLLVQCTSFSAGLLAQMMVRSGYPVGWWGIPENGVDGAVLYNSFCSINMYQAIGRNYYNEEKIPTKWFFGEVSDPLFAPRLAVTVRALRAIKRLRTSRIGLIGGIAPGFNDLYFDERKLLRLFPGMQYDRQIEFDDIASRAESYAEAEIARDAEAYEKAAKGVHPASVKHKLLNARLLRAYRELIAEHHFDALAISCWPKFQARYDYSVCSVIGQLNDERFPAACEGDTLSAVNMLMLQEMSGQPTMLMDLSGFDTQDDSMLLWHCGPAASNFASEDGYTLGVNYTGKAHIPGEGMGCCGVAREMVFGAADISIGRLTADLDGMLVAGGTLLAPDEKPSFHGSRGWASKLQLNGEPISSLDFVNTILSHGFPHHYPIAKGRYQAELMEVAAWLGLRTLEKTLYKTWLQV